MAERKRQLIPNISKEVQLTLRTVSCTSLFFNEMAIVALLLQQAGVTQATPNAIFTHMGRYVISEGQQLRMGVAHGDA